MAFVVPVSCHCGFDEHDPHCCFETHTNAVSVSLTAVHTFRIYCSGSHGPVLFLLHGGGHSALSWAVFTVSVRTITEYPHTLNSPLPSVKNMWILLLFFSIAAYFIYNTFKTSPMGFWVAGGHMQQDQLQGGGHGPSSSRWTFYLIMSQLILNQIELFYCHMQFATVVVSKDIWSLEVMMDVTPQLYHVWDKTNVCFFPLWQVTPKWKTKMISQQTQWPSKCLYAVKTGNAYLHFAYCTNQYW